MQDWPSRSRPSLRPASVHAGAARRPSGQTCSFRPTSYSGLAAMAFVALFWLVVVLRTDRHRCRAANARGSARRVGERLSPTCADMGGAAQLPPAALCRGRAFLRRNPRARALLDDHDGRDRHVLFHGRSGRACPDRALWRWRWMCTALLANLVWAYLIGHARPRAPPSLQLVT